MIAAAMLWLAQAPNADSLPPREKPTEYQASVSISGGCTLASDYLGHSAPASRGVLFTPDHVVVEVAIFGSGAIDLNTSHFRLQLTGGRGAAKEPVRPEPASVVAASMREGSMSSYGRPNLEASGTIQDRGVILGRRRPTTGVPDLDSQRPGRGPDPPVTGAPGHDRSGNAKEVPLEPAEALASAEVANGEWKLPVRGLLYFPYRGKLKALKTITLLYQPEANSPAISLSLLP